MQRKMTRHQLKKATTRKRRGRLTWIRRPPAPMKNGRNTRSQRWMLLNAAIEDPNGQQQKPARPPFHHVSGGSLRQLHPRCWSSHGVLARGKGLSSGLCCVFEVFSCRSDYI